jgi:tetratricopeptide (TPR) repeat protein
MPARSPTILLVEPFQDATSANELWPNPNDTELIAEYGMRLALSGEWVRGCPLIEQAHARNPSPQADYEVMLGLCSYMQGDYQKALFWIRRADLQKSPLYHFVAAAIYGQLGDASAAGATVTGFLIDGENASDQPLTDVQAVLIPDRNAGTWDSVSAYVNNRRTNPCEPFLLALSSA